MRDLAAIETRLQNHRPRRLPGRGWMPRSAVAVILTRQEQGPSVLLIRRAMRDGDPWSGHMAFPGGRLETGDAGGAAAACRETCEETGLTITRAERIGRLHDRITRTHSKPLPMVVSPFVFRYPDAAQAWQLNHEVENTVWLPLAFLADHDNRNRMTWRVGPAPVPLPCYHYQGQRIWGLTLLMLDELIRLA